MRKRAEFLEIMCSFGESVKTAILPYLELSMNIISALPHNYLAGKRKERELYEQARREFNGSYLRLN